MAEIIRIDESTTRIEDGQVRFFLLEGREKALLIDTGMTTADAKEIAESLTDLPVVLLNTHADRDHIAGNRAFDETYMSPAEEENYIANGYDGTRGRIIPVRERDIIDLGDRPLEIIDNPGHTPGSIAILDVNRRVLIGGDAIQDGNIFMFGKYRNIRQYAESLQHIQSYRNRFDTVYASHGTFEVGPEMLDLLISGAEEIIAGNVTGTEVDMFGRKVCLYRFPYAGFLCDL